MRSPILLSLAVIGASGRAKARVAPFKGVLILGAAIAVAIQTGWRPLASGVDAGWPDVIIAAAPLVMFLRSAWRVLRAALVELKQTS